MGRPFLQKGPFHTRLCANLAPIPWKEPHEKDLSQFGMHSRHPGESRGPDSSRKNWIPAFAGMTKPRNGSKSLMLAPMPLAKNSSIVCGIEARCFWVVRCVRWSGHE